jgi:hypothetical protein
MQNIDNKVVIVGPEGISNFAASDDDLSLAIRGGWIGTLWMLLL